MNTVSYSTLEELKTAISSYNPFSRVAVDNVNSIRKEEPYLKSLNASIFEKVIDVIRQVKHSSDGKDKVATLVITGDVGSGKTQLVKRIRRHCVNQDIAILIYANIAKCSNSDLLHSQFVEILVKELAITERDENKNFKPNQWQEIATAMLNSSNPRGKIAVAANVVNNFDSAYIKAKEKNQNLIQLLSLQVKKRYPHFDAYTVRAILWTLSPTYGDYAVEWLAGNPLDSETAQGMGLPNYADQDIVEKNSAAFSKLLKIVPLVSEYKTLIICLDEFDDKVSDCGETNAQLIAEFIKNLHDNLEQSNFSQGITIISLMFESVWKDQLKNYFSLCARTDVASVIDRMSTATKGEPLSLQPINGKSILELVSFWLEEFLYKPRQLKPHDSVYPFTVEKLEEVAKSRPTIRETLDWCYKEYKKIQETIVKDPKEQYQLARQQTKPDITDYLEDNDFLANTLKFGFEQLINQPLEGVTASGEKLKRVIIDSVESIDNKWVKFKLNGIENESKRFTIGVAVIQNQTATPVRAGLKELVKYSKFGLTRGCMVRSPDKKINKNTQAYQLLEQLTTKLGGEQAPLHPEEIQPLIEIYSIYQNCQSFGLTEEQVKEFSQGEIANNPLLQEILSDPSGKIDEYTLDSDELILLFDQFFEQEEQSDEDINDLLS
jgi:Cdc6-like AAA superfamily ATPase